VIVIVIWMVAVEAAAFEYLALKALRLLAGQILG
jgi:hypothetical protein